MRHLKVEKLDIIPSQHYLNTLFDCLSKHLQSDTYYFNSNSASSEAVVLNIDNVVEFDNNALSEIKDLARTTLLNKNAFTIVGNGCKKICESFNQI